MGVNDADYQVTKWECLEERYCTGRPKKVLVWVCPFYRKWKSLIERCYSKKALERCNNYRDCTVCDEWKSFMNFRSWMVVQDWENKELDKDLLVEGNKVYSPQNCYFITKVVNTFLVSKDSARGDYLLGCSYCHSTNKFKAECNNPFTKKREYLGVFDTELEAHTAWKKRKHELACQLADSEYVDDELVAEALKRRYY